MRLLSLLSCACLVLVLAPSSEARSSRQFLKKCPRGFDLVFDRHSRKLSCDCKRHHLYWPATGLCYGEFTQGPCSRGNRLVLNITSGQPFCQCPAFWSRYEDGTCHEDYTRGPCPSGQLLVHDPSSQRGVCRCDKEMVMHYFAETGRCYPKYSQGPCKRGHIIKFDYRSLSPRCECRDGYEKWTDGHCYKINTVGPCKADQCAGTPCFTRNLQTLRTQCTCLASWARVEEGSCYEPYFQGPCPAGHWLVPTAAASTGNDTTAIVTSEQNGFVCQPKKHCTRFDNWFYWESTQRCYRQFSRGPCPAGQLFYMNPASGAAGCRCDRHWKAYFWPADNSCYEQHSVGPCPRGMFFGFNFTSDQAECRCFKSHVFNPVDGTCVEQFTRGACRLGELSSADELGKLTCACSSQMLSHYWPKDGRCYEHYKRGPCEDGQTFRIDHSGGKPGCVVWQG